MEILDVIDANNNVVSKASKEECHIQGLPHRVSAVLIKNVENKYLIPTASELKVEKGKLYHSAAGHVSSGSTYEQTATRELEEETGLRALDEDLKLLGTYWFIKNYPERIEKERFQVYIINEED